ncbi:MAG: 3-deoxy-manno-octulosonate cytidylyltransferase [Prevotella sp.]|nr:3-deoxy-manno-octulosonate cytidylyltransferase [Prevotella sp.]
MKYIAIIPARYASTRFPGKPLAMLGGKTVIRRVYEQVNKQMDATWVATDDSRIYDHVVSWGGNAVMTSPDHKSGTDRIEEAMEKIEASGGTYDVVVNVQGDEPFIQPEQIEAVCKCFDDVQTQIATLGIRFASAEACGAETGQDEVWRRISNANSPKIVVDNKGFAMYFSRSVIPFVRGKECTEWAAAYPFMKHIGMYAYRRNVLREITSLPQSSLEQAESLEQLRWLQNGYKIKVGETFTETIGIDTPEDLAKAQALL